MTTEKKEINWLGWMQLAVSVIGVAVAAYFANVVHEASHRLAIAEHDRALREAFRATDETALQGNGRDTEFVNGFWTGKPVEAKSEEEKFRKINLAYINLDVIYTMHLGVEEGIARSWVEADIKRRLTNLLKDDTMYQCSQEGTFSPSFKELCKKIRNDQ